MSDPMLQLLREEIAALRALLDETQRRAAHDYAALQDEYRTVCQQQLAEVQGLVIASAGLGAGTADPGCPF